MQTEGPVYTPEALIEELFRKEYDGLLRYAEVVLRRHGSRHVSVSGRAEDVVQELFYLALKKQDEVFESKSPVGWLYEALVRKVREALREDRAWVKRLALLTEEPGPGDISGTPEGWTELLPREDYELLRKIYLEGYSYKELCAELGVKKSTLAMRVSRIKERFRKNFSI